MQRASQLIRQAEQQNGSLWLVASEQVESEYQAHVLEVLAELQSVTSRLEAAVSTLASPADGRAFGDQASLLHTSLGEFLDRMWANCSCIAHEPSIQTTANARLSQRLAPARKGGAGLGDCLVWESFLQLSMQLRQGGFPERIIFVSSNKADFGRPAAPKDNLAPEMATWSIDFADSLESAYDLLFPS